MPIPTIPTSLYPLVPNAPGVPNLLRSGAAILDTATLHAFGISDALDSLLGTNTPQWGIFNQYGKSIALADSAVSVEYNSTSRVSDYPVEEGSFAAYNKVANPWDAKVTLTKGGTVNDRADFIDALEQAANSTDLYRVVTPEKTYENANIEGWGYRRSAESGAGIIIAEVYLREVRQSATAAFSDTQNPASADPMSQGQVQGVNDATVAAAGVMA